MSELWPLIYPKLAVEALSALLKYSELKYSSTDFQ